MIRCYHNMFCCWNEISIENAASWLYFVAIFFPSDFCLRSSLRVTAKMSIGKTLVMIFHKSRCFRIHRSPGIPSKDSWSTKKMGSVNDDVHNFCRVSVEKKWNNIFGIAEQNTSD